MDTFFSWFHYLFQLLDTFVSPLGKAASWREGCLTEGRLTPCISDPPESFDRLHKEQIWPKSCLLESVPRPSQNCTSGNMALWIQSLFERELVIFFFNLTRHSKNLISSFSSRTQWQEYCLAISYSFKVFTWRKPTLGFFSHCNTETQVWM